MRLSEWFVWMSDRENVSNKKKTQLNLDLMRQNVDITISPQKLNFFKKILFRFLQL